MSDQEDTPTETVEQTEAEPTKEPSPEPEPPKEPTPEPEPPKEPTPEPEPPKEPSPEPEPPKEPTPEPEPPKEPSPEPEPPKEPSPEPEPPKEPTPEPTPEPEPPKEPTPEPEPPKEPTPEPEPPKEPTPEPAVVETTQEPASETEATGEQSTVAEVEVTPAAAGSSVDATAGDEVKEKPKPAVPTRQKFYSIDPAVGVDLAMGEGMSSIEPETIGAALKKTVAKFPERRALGYKDGDEWKYISFPEYYKLSVAAAKSFIKLGLEDFHGVGILGFNSKEWFIANMGGIFAGGLSFGIYATNNAEACQYVAHDCKANILVVENQKQLDKILAVRDQLPHLKAIVQYTGKLSQEYENTYDWEQFMELGKDMDDQVVEDKIAAQRPEQCALLVYTSGTTGNPKGVMLSHDNVIWVSKSFWEHHRMSNAQQQVAVSYLPLSHIAAQIADIYFGVVFGGLVCFAQPDALKGSLRNTLLDVRPTLFFGVPRVWEKLAAALKAAGAEVTGFKRTIGNWAKSKSLRGYRNIQKNESVPWGWTIANKILEKVKKGLGFDRCQVMITGAAPIQPEIVEYFMSVGLPVMEVYGMSENAGPHTCNNMRHWRLGTVGVLIPGATTRIDDPDTSGEGEICMYGRHVFMGYLNNEVKTKEAIDEQGWLHTGDIGKVDDAGFLSITGRIKELIITSGGENMAPVPVENRIKEAARFLSNVVMIGDKRKFVSCLVTFKVVMDPDTGEGTDDLEPATIAMISELGSKCTKVSEIMEQKDDPVYAAITKALEKNNEQAVSNAQKVQKFTILPKDFSTATGELGPTLKLKRHVVNKMYVEQIDSMYQD